jgi:hypothetical protein
LESINSNPFNVIVTETPGLDCTKTEQDPNRFVYESLNVIPSIAMGTWGADLTTAVFSPSVTGTGPFYLPSVTVNSATPINTAVTFRLTAGCNTWFLFPNYNYRSNILELYCSGIIFL